MADDGPKMRVKLTLEAKNLRIGSSKLKNSMVWVSEKDSGQQEFSQIGMTEVVKGEDDPEYITRIVMDFKFEMKQVLKFSVFQVKDGVDPSSLNPEEAALFCQAPLSAIVSSKGGKKELDLAPPEGAQGSGILKILAEEVKDLQHSSIELKIRGQKLAAKDGMFGKSDPYLRIFRLRGDGDKDKVYESEVIDQNLDPEWKPFELNLVDLCNGDMDAKILIEVWDKDKLSKDDQIGLVVTTTKALSTEKSIQLKDYKEGRDLDPGTLVIEKAQLLPLIRTPTFLDYISGGAEINLTVAVDFTASNGHPTTSSSLHRRSKNPSDLNPYEKVLQRVGEVLIEYDHDGHINALGYGGILKGTRSANHCFSLKGSGEAQVTGLSGLMEAYKESLNSVKLSGPTNFAEVINKAAESARNAGDGNYHVLLIITDGAISDKQKTAKAIVEASQLQMSIIIAGVGSANFAAMEKLDGDDEAVKSLKGSTAMRDIVQFVPFEKFQGDGVALAAEVLHELPDQFLEYMCKNAIKPKNWPFQLPEGDWTAPAVTSRGLDFETGALALNGVLVLFVDATDKCYVWQKSWRIRRFLLSSPWIQARRPLSWKRIAKAACRSISASKATENAGFTSERRGLAE